MAAAARARAHGTRRAVCAAGRPRRRAAAARAGAAGRRDFQLALLALGLCTSPARRAAAVSALTQQREFDLLVLLDQQKEREQEIASGAAQRGQEDSVLEAEIRNLKAEIKAIEDNAVYCEQAKKRIDGKKRGITCAPRSCVPSPRVRGSPC